MSSPTEPNDPETKGETTIAPPRRTYINNLTPPSNFVFWKRQESTIFTNRRLNRPGHSTEYVTVNWKCEFYVYTTSARPTDPGVVFYIVMVHSGDVNSTLTRAFQDFGLRVAAPSATAQAQLPGYSTQSGNDWLASINYRQAMQMFANGGNSAETFIAEYVRDYHLRDMDQTGAIVNNRAEIRITSIPGTGWQTAKEIHGLTVFRHTNLNNFPLTFNATAWTIYGENAAEVTANTSIRLPFEG